MSISSGCWWSWFHLKFPTRQYSRLCSTHHHPPGPKQGHPARKTVTHLATGAVRSACQQECPHSLPFLRLSEQRVRREGIEDPACLAEGRHGSSAAVECATLNAEVSVGQIICASNVGSLFFVRATSEPKSMYYPRKSET